MYTCNCKYRATRPLLGHLSQTHLVISVFLSNDNIARTVNFVLQIIGSATPWGPQPMDSDPIPLPQASL